MKRSTIALLIAGAALIIYEIVTILGGGLLTGRISDVGLPWAAIVASGGACLLAIGLVKAALESKRTRRSGRLTRPG